MSFNFNYNRGINTSHGVDSGYNKSSSSSDEISESSSIITNYINKNRRLK